MGSLDIRLVRVADVSEDPLSEDLISTLRIRIEGGGMDPLETEFDIRDRNRGTLSDVPVGHDRVVTVEGLSIAGKVESRGVSAPFEMGEGNIRLYLFFSRVDRFSSPPSVGTDEPQWTYRYTTRMATERMFHAATLLPDYSVLVTGGAINVDPDDVLERLASDSDDPARRWMEVFDSTAGAFLLLEEERVCEGAGAGTLCLRAERVRHCAEQVPGSDLVVLAGGDPFEADWSGEFFTPATRTFGPKAALLEPRTRQACAVVEGDRSGILVAGGSGATSSELLDAIELFENGGFQRLNGAALSQSRSGAVAVATSRGAVIVGGWQDWDLRTPSRRVDHVMLGSETATVESFDMNHARAEHSAVLIQDDPDGTVRVLVCGGLNDSIPIEPEPSCEILDVANQASSDVPGVSFSRWAHTATRLQDGRVLLAGGFSTTGPFVATSGAWLLGNLEGVPTPVAVIGGMKSPRAGHSATLLPNGMVLMVGGATRIDPVSGVDLTQQHYEIFNPDPTFLPR